MLSDAFDLGAAIELSDSDGTKSVDVRQMLQAGHFRYWLSGGICTQVIVEEVAPDPVFDLAFNGHKSFHPIFVLTFYPGHRGVKVDFIGENAWTTRLQDLRYSLTLRTGHPLQAEAAYEKPDYTHIARARWRKVFWSGEPLGRVLIDYNLPYMIQSRALPNYDLSRTVSARGVALEVAANEPLKNGEIGENLIYPKYMATTGGRGELGILPRWDVRFLYTNDPALEQIMLNYAAVSAHIPIHYRESAPGKNFSLDALDAPAVGRVVSIDARPGFCSRDFRFSSKRDIVTPVGAVTNGGWTPDTAHQPSFTFVSYLTTGDWFYLEEMFFWAAWDVAWADPGTGFNSRGSGGGVDSDSYGFMWAHTNTRAYAWMLRNLAQAALMAPDGSPEKAYLTAKLLNNIAIHEGRLNITDGYASSDPSREDMWKFGRNVVDSGIHNPLGFWHMPQTANVVPTDTIVNPAKATTSEAPWMHHLIFACVGYIDEMGYPMGALRRRAMDFLLDELTHPDYNPYQVAQGRMPSAPALDRVFTTWRDVYDAFQPQEQTSKTWAGYPGDSDFGYGYIALSAASFLPGVERDGRRGIDALQWLKDNYPRQEVMNDNPKWAIVPRDVDYLGSLLSPKSWAARNRRWLAKPATARRR
jgi:hypothetical protein